MTESTNDTSETRDLQCPYCGYVVVNDRGIGAKFCGPHVDGNGVHVKGPVRMRVIRDWDEFRKENGL